jgi:hypothetical protein
MYKSLLVATAAAVLAYLCNFYPHLLALDYLKLSQATLSLNPTLNISSMAVASVSRRVVNKVFAVETPEVNLLMNHDGCGADNLTFAREQEHLYGGQLGT